MYKTLLILVLLGCGFQSPNQLFHEPRAFSGVISFYPDSINIKYQKAFYIENVFLNEKNFKIYTWEIDSVMPGHYEKKILFNFTKGIEKYLILYRLYKYHKTDIPIKKEDWDTGVFTVLINLNEKNKPNPKKSIIAFPSIDNTEISNKFYVPDNIELTNNKLAIFGHKNLNSHIYNIKQRFKIVADLKIDSLYTLEDFKGEFDKFLLLD